VVNSFPFAPINVNNRNATIMVVSKTAVKMAPETSAVVIIDNFICGQWLEAGGLEVGV